MEHFFPLKHFLPQKKLGQNFLDQSTANALVAKFGLDSQQPVLEIGPGFGALTTALIKQSRPLFLLEKDSRLTKWLRQKYQPLSNIKIIQADLLTFDFVRLPAVKLTVVSNLPYNVATAILQKLFLAASHFNQLLLTFPLPVAHRILALNNKNSYLAICCALFCRQISQIAFLPRKAFTPVPKIDSLVLRFVLRTKPLLPLSVQSAFLSFVKLAFHHPRKFLINNLHPQFDRFQLLKVFQVQKWPSNLRAETLTMPQFLRLYNALKK